MQEDDGSMKSFLLVCYFVFWQNDFFILGHTFVELLYEKILYIYYIIVVGVRL